MSDINKYFDLGIYNEEETNTHLDNLIKLNYIEIDINYYNFNIDLTVNFKKKLFRKQIELFIKWINQHLRIKNLRNI